MDLINNNYNINQSSIQTLAKGSPGEDLITGEKSFGAFMEREGYCALPSPINPKPGEKSLESVLPNFDISERIERVYYKSYKISFKKNASIFCVILLVLISLC